jgi:hypothetical protein
MVLVTVSYDLIYICYGRLLIVAVLISSTCGMYQAECSRGPRRGKLSVIVVLHNVIFYCIASWLTLGCSYINSSAQWRLPMAIQVTLSPQRFLTLLIASDS